MKGAGIDLSAPLVHWVIPLLILSWTSWLYGAPVDPASESSALQVRFIQFKGAETFSAKELKKILDTKEKRFAWFTKAPFDEKVFQEDLERLEKFYLSQGFYHARIVSHRVARLVGREVRVEIEVHEGPAMQVADIKLLVNGQSMGPWHEELEKLSPLHPGDRFTTEGYQDIETVILQYLSDWGYPKARVDLRARLDKRVNKAEVTVDVTTGPVCFFGPTILEGHEHVEDHVILRELTFKEGERFNGSKLTESQQRLFNLDLFQWVDFKVEDMEGETTTLPVRILLKEAKTQTVRLGVGYGTEDELRGQVQWEIRDFLGDGRRLQLNAKASSLVQRLDTKLLQPHLLDPPGSLTLEGGISQENQESFENRQWYIRPLYSYWWTPEVSASFGYNLEANRLLEVSIQPIARGPEDQEHEEYFVSSLVEGASWDRVNDVLNPREGFRLIQNLEWASIALGSEVDYIKLTLEGRGYLPIRKYGILAARIKWGGIQELENTQDLPIFKRFFAGGSESVRGYPYQRLGPLDEDGYPIGGMTLIEGNLEWRFPIRNSFEGVLFFDFGNVFEDRYELLWESMGYAAGFGVRYLTFVGPLRLDFGYQLNPPEHDFFSPYQIHFSIGQAF